ncbi:MAG: cytochrome c biogenesis protein CcdA [Candidatus Zixiibacteriota bacterium]|nr:MAG: cytochrome c biogenesis protein CcdA [candidate division Zixibacteria bacterium]
MENLASYLQGNPLVAVAAVFAGGLLSAASPCVLAIMPMVIGYVGGHAGGDRKKAAAYSLLFALGLALTFTLLGAAAALLGRLMGDVGRIWYWIVAGLAIAMGLSLMGVFSMRLPFAEKMQTKRRGALGAFLLGLLFGVVSSPCATPVLVVILAFVAAQGQVLWGTSLLFVYALGHCALIILAGVVTGFVEAFVQSRGAQNFSTWAKRASGALIVLGGLYVLYVNL